MTPELFVVVGPNGSGKSSALYETKIDREIVFVNPDDIARLEYADVEDQHRRDLLAWMNCNAQRDGLLSERVTFGFETVGSHPSKVEFMAKAKELGYRVTLLFVSTEAPKSTSSVSGHELTKAVMTSQEKRFVPGILGP